MTQAASVGPRAHVGLRPERKEVSRDTPLDWTSHCELWAFGQDLELAVPQSNEGGLFQIEIVRFASLFIFCQVLSRQTTP